MTEKTEYFKSEKSGEFLVISDLRAMPVNEIRTISNLDDAVNEAKKRCMDEKAGMRIYRLEKIFSVFPEKVLTIQPVVYGESGAKGMP